MLSTTCRVSASVVGAHCVVARRCKAYDVAVVGGGPGGYVAAIKAGQAGLKVACVESRGALGGTCLNVGCIPTKAMLQSTHMMHEAKVGGAKHGFAGGNGIKADYKKMTANRDKTVGALTKGIEFLFKKNKVDYIKAKGHLTSANTIAAGDVTIEAQHIILATGSVPAPMPGNFLKVDQKKVFNSDGLLALSEVPKKMIIVGGGAIGLEFGTVFARLGTKVEVVEFMPQIAAGFDSDVADALGKLLKKEGITIHLNHKVVEADVKGEGVKIRAVDKAGKNVEFVGDVVLVAVGRKPFSKGLGLKKLKVQKDGAGRVKVDQYFKSSVSPIRAIGDLIEGPMLAHKAEEDGVACVNNILGHQEALDHSVMPGVIYTHPEAATVGKTEDTLKKEKMVYNKGVFPIVANSRGRCNQDTDGFVKVLSEKDTNKILGVSILAPNAGDLIQEFVLAMKYNVTAKQVADVVHAHPTLSEALKEASLAAVYGKAVHM